MQINYNSNTDVLYLQLEHLRQPITNKRISEDVVLDMGQGDRIIDIEILDAQNTSTLTA